GCGQRVEGMRAIERDHPCGTLSVGPDRSILRQAHHTLFHKLLLLPARPSVEHSQATHFCAIYDSRVRQFQILIRVGRRAGNRWTDSRGDSEMHVTRWATAAVLCAFATAPIAIAHQAGSSADGGRPALPDAKLAAQPPAEWSKQDI